MDNNLFLSAPPSSSLLSYFPCPTNNASKMATSSLLFNHHLTGFRSSHDIITQASPRFLDQLSSWATFWTPSSFPTEVQGTESSRAGYFMKEHQLTIVPRKRKIVHDIEIDYSRETDVRTRTNHYHTTPTELQQQQQPQTHSSNNTYDKSLMLKVHQITMRKLQTQQAAAKRPMHQLCRQHRQPCKLTLSNLIHIRHVWDQIDRLMNAEANMKDQSSLCRAQHILPSKRFPLYTDRVYLMSQKKISSSSPSSMTRTMAGKGRHRCRASFALSTLVYSTATHQNDTTLEIIRILPTISTIRNYSAQRHEMYIQHYYSNLKARQDHSKASTAVSGRIKGDDDDDDDDDIPLGTLRYIHH